MTTSFINPLSNGEHSLPRWFGAGRDASIAFVERFHSSPSPTALFHYTNTAALISIIRNDELWLSDATFLNDKIEVEHGRQLANACLAEAVKSEHCGEVREMLQRALSKFETSADPNVYVACFSLDGDDLAQWRGYGQRGAPVAIEFERGPLMFGYTSEGLVQQVLYDLDEQNWALNQVLSAYAKLYAEDLCDPRPSLRPEPLSLEEEREICAGKLYHDLWRYIVACKNSTFRSEQEVRFTYTAHDFSQNAQGWYPEHPDPEFREHAGRVIPYLSSKKLDFRNVTTISEPPKLPIRSIRVGPTDDQRLIARGIRRLLDTFDNRAVEITLSDSPFRGE